MIRRTGTDTWTITVPAAGGTAQLFLAATGDGTVVLTVAGAARLDRQTPGS